MITKDTSGEYIRNAAASHKKIIDLLGKTVTVGKHGYVRLINVLGSDELIVESARQSYKMEDAILTPEKTRVMIHNMTRNGHTSPFEQASITFKIKMPIFVCRQWIRSRTARLNEASMRYTKSQGECWAPDDHTWEMRHIYPETKVADDNTDKESVESLNQKAFANYLDLLGPDHKYPPELARVVLPLTSYTEFVWNIDLNNLRKMLSLRLDSHAQREIFEFATAVFMLAKEAFPITMDEFLNEIFFSKSFTLKEIEDITTSIYKEDEISEVVKKIDGKRQEIVRNREALFKEIDHLSKSNFKEDDDSYEVGDEDIAP